MAKEATMKNLFNLMLLMAISLASFTLKAECLDVIDDRVKELNVKLDNNMASGKKTVKIAAIGTFIPMTILSGIAAKAIIDGGTLATAAIVGTSFGLMSSGVAVAAVIVPFFTYRQIIKSQYKSLIKTRELIQASQRMDTDNELIQKMYRKVKRKRDDVEIYEMMEKISNANLNEAICPVDRGVYSFSKIKRLLKNEDLSKEAVIIL